jgi:hypothetical protein
MKIKEKLRLIQQEQKRNKERVERWKRGSHG